MTAALAGAIVPTPLSQRALAVMHIRFGVFKGRKLLSPPKAAQTRPITGLASKSLFGILRGRLAEATVADLYCGTGTLGLEALSNGAARCIFAERDRTVLTRLRRNIATLGVEDRCTVWSGDVRRGLAGRLAALEGRLDVVFVDPPYAHSRRWDWPALARELFAPLAGALADDGLVVLRTDTHGELPEDLAGLTCCRRREFGSMLLSFWARPQQPEATETP